jgi:hypothetical protein
MTSLGFGRTTLLVALGLAAAVGCRRGDAVRESKARPADAGSPESAESVQTKAAAEQEQAAGKQALERWTARMKALLGALPATLQLKPGCDNLAASTPLASVDSVLLDSIKRSPTGVVSAAGSAGFPSLQSRAVRNLFYEAHREGAVSLKQLIAAGVELDATKFLAVFDLSEVTHPNMLSRDSWAGGAIKGALVVFDLSNDTAACRIPLVAKSPSKSEAAKRYGAVDTSGIDLERQILDWTAMDLRRKALERLSKTGTGISLAEGSAP